MAESKWIRFVDLGKIKGQSTNIYEVVTKDEGFVIAEIKWYAPFRKYSFFPSEMTVFETQCLSDIISFIKDLMEARHIEKQANKKV